jgi:hypothetical protein
MSREDLHATVTRCQAILATAFGKAEPKALSVVKTPCGSVSSGICAGARSESTAVAQAFRKEVLRAPRRSSEIEPTGLEGKVKPGDYRGRTCSALSWLTLRKTITFAILFLLRYDGSTENLNEN